MPSLLEYLSYNCNFMGILAGPTCSYNDYKAFIEGTCYQPRHQETANGKENGKRKQSEPSPKVQHRVDHNTIVTYVDFLLCSKFKPLISILHSSEHF